jgi:uncharacterized membrane protein YdjX (TVP38/TMEM64 family)
LISALSSGFDLHWAKNTPKSHLVSPEVCVSVKLKVAPCVAMRHKPHRQKGYRSDAAPSTEYRATVPAATRRGVAAGVTLRDGRFPPVSPSRRPAPARRERIAAAAPLAAAARTGPGRACGADPPPPAHDTRTEDEVSIPGEPTTAPPGPVQASPLRKLLYGLGILAGLAALWWLGRQGGQHVPAFAAWVDGLGLWGPLVFVAGYAVAAVALVPGSILTLAAGAIFGLAEGTLYTFVGASLGACGAFLVSRYLARSAVERRLERYPRFAAVDTAVGREGRKIVFLLRLSPVFPFNLLNYGLGLTRVRFVDYAVACVGMLPGTFLYVYYGKLLGDVAAVAGGAEVERGPGYWLVLGLGIAATLAVTALITAKARQALQRETDLDLDAGAEREGDGHG